MSGKVSYLVVVTMVLLAVGLSACGGSEQEVTMGTASGDYVSPALATMTVGKSLNEGVLSLVGSFVMGAAASVAIWLAAMWRSVEVKRSVLAVAGLVVFAVSLGAAVLNAASVAIDAGRVGVLVSQGKAVATLAPGFHLITPYWQKVVTFSTRDWTFITMSEPIEQGSEEYRTWPLGIVTEDGVSASVKFSVQGRLNPHKALHVYEHYGTLENAIVQLIKSPALGIVRTRIQGFKAMDLIESIDAVGEDVGGQLRPIVEEGGITMVFFSFRRPDLGAWAEELNNARVAEQQAVVAEQQIAIAEAEARQAAAEAEGERQVTEINAEGQAAATLAQRRADADAELYAARQAAEAEKVAADGDAYAILARAQAEAEANALVADSLTSDLILYKMWANWNGQLPTWMTSEAEPLISVSSPRP
jgi:regulator of protease activity HflC (stomatin/prohibitin superfamily)